MAVHSLESKHERGRSISDAPSSFEAPQNTRGGAASATHRPCTRALGLHRGLSSSRAHTRPSRSEKEKHAFTFAFAWSNRLHSRARHLNCCHTIIRHYSDCDLVPSNVYGARWCLVHPGSSPPCFAQGGGPPSMEAYHGATKMAWRAAACPRGIQFGTEIETSSSD